MKKLFTLLFVIVATTALWAEDFEVNGIYYNKNKTNEVEVTYRGFSYDSYSNEYSGSVTIPSTVTYNGTTYSVTRIGYLAFYGCSGLTSVTIPEGVTCIDDAAFGDCSSLTSITIPNSVKSIGMSAFGNCSSLTSITIPNSVKSIEMSAFVGCSGLTSIVVEEGNTRYDSRENCNAIIETATNTLIAGCQNTIIPNSVTSIGEGAFYYCSGLTSVTIPNSVTSIGVRAFEYCTGLTSIVVEKGNTVYDSRENCNAIIETNSNTLILGCQNTIIPNSVTSIGDKAFYNCTGLTSVIIGNSVTSIGESAFRYCSSLTSVVWNAKNCADFSYSSSPFYDLRSQITSFTFGDSVQHIPAYMCYGMSNLTSITIPNSVISIGGLAFEYCTGLKSITIPNSVTSIGSYAFCYCSNLKKIYLEPTTPPSLGYNVFNSKPEAYVPWSSLEVYADSEWKDYVSEFKEFIHYSGVLDNGITWKYDNGKLLISGNGALIYQRAPWIPLIDSIQSIEMTNGITSISESAFANYKKLTKVTLPASLEEIGANAFAGCRKLYELYLYAETPPTAEVSSFTNYNAYLYIPCEAQRYYKADMVFYLFPNLQCISSDEVPTDDVVITPGSNDVTITWPTEENADTYSIVIKKDGKVVCTLTFNSEGQLLNIAFAPGREGNHPVQYAEATTNGYRFTVPGLEEGTDYTYTVTSKDAANKTISEHSGEFTTQSTTALDNINSQSPITNVQKIIRDGQLLIIRDGKTYNAQGAAL